MVKLGKGARVVERSSKAQGGYVSVQGRHAEPRERVLRCAKSRGSASIEGRVGKTNINDLQRFLPSSPVTFWGSLQENSPTAIT